MGTGRVSDLVRKAKKAVRLFAHPLWRRGLYHGVAAAVEHTTLPIARELATVIDVGAHKGQFALFIKGYRPGVELHCFEPLSGPGAALRRLFQEDRSVHVYGVALAAKEGSGDMYVSKRNDSSSLRELTAIQVSTFPGTDLSHVESVAVKCLDTTLDVASLKTPLLLKVDVQGSELDVLRGATDVLKSCRQVIVECSFVEFYSGQALFGDVYGYLTACGFKLVAASCNTCSEDGAWLQADVLFETKAWPRRPGQLPPGKATQDP